MRRFLLTLLLVSAMAAWIRNCERTVGAGDGWVRTAQGWQRRCDLLVNDQPPWPELHPLLIAGFQAGVGLIGLAAFPSRIASVAASPRHGGQLLGTAPTR